MVAQTNTTPAPTFVGNTSIESRTGCQQGDVFSPLFCLVVHRTLASFRNEVVVAYLDDFRISSHHPRDILDDINRLCAGYAVHGLSVNPSKCEVFISGSSEFDWSAVNQQVAEALPGCRHIAGEASVDLLGTSNFDAGIDRALEARSAIFEVISRPTQHVGSCVHYRTQGGTLGDYGSNQNKFEPRKIVEFLH